MLHLKDLLWNVHEITKNNPDAHDGGVAFAMLRTNIQRGHAVYPGTKLDWASLKQAWDAMTPEEQSQSREEYFLCDDVPGLWDAYHAGDRETFDALKEAELYRKTHPEETPE